jgi:hypothetical protein
MSKIKQNKIPVTLIDDKLLMDIAVEQGVIENELKYKLVRERDGLINQSKEIKWLEFDENGRYKADYQEPEVGRSLIMSPFNAFFTWQTTIIIEIVEQKEGYVKFKTENSNYELFTL